MSGVVTVASQFNILDNGLSVPKGSLLRKTGVLGETIPRWTTMSSQNVLSSGRLQLFLIYLEGGVLVSTIAMYSGGTAATTPTNQWFALYDLSRNKLAVTADDTNTAWGTTTRKALAVASPYRIPASGFYYAGIMVAAAAVPTLFGTAPVTALTQEAPIMSGFADTGLTNPASAPATAAALTASGGTAYVEIL